MPFTLTTCRRRSSASLILDSHGISQSRLAELVGVSQSTLSRVLAGRQPVPAGLDRILRVLIGVSDTCRVFTAIDEARP